jgi:phosphoribosylformylglycinamidine cyclo-ligase
LPPGVTAVVDRSSWAPQPIFDLIARTGPVGLDQLELAFNLGVGMVAIVAGDRQGDALDIATARGVPAWRLGEVCSAGTQQSAGPPHTGVSMRGSYAGLARDWT